jgi:uncharacterized protein with HEPN domain
MATAKDKIYIEHIFEAIQLIEDFIAGKTLTEFEADPMLHSAVTRQIEIIGEAAKRLSEEYKDTLGHLPWRRITGMRDFLIHDYIDVDLEIVWKAATEDIKELKRALEQN